MEKERVSHENPCPTCERPELLLAYAAHLLDDSERAFVVRSLERCELCRLAAKDNADLAHVIRRSARPLHEASPEQLVALASRPEREADDAGLSEADRALIAILRRVDADIARGAERAGLIAGLRRLWASGRGEGRWAFIPSPALAYLLLLVLAYPAYLGITRGSAPGPVVIEPPRSLDTAERTARGAALVLDDGRATTVSVFVPVDERFRYRLEIRDESGRLRFADDDVESFDGVGTIAVLLPRGFLARGDYEVRVIELPRDGSGEALQTFRFPFQIL